MSSRLVAILLAAMALAGGGARAEPITDAAERAFLARCEKQVRRAQLSAALGDDHCRFRWRQVLAAAPLAEVLIALAPATGATPPSRQQLRVGAPGVRWTGDDVGELGEFDVRLARGGTGIGFHWQRTGAEIHHDVVEALRLRNASFHTLGCPQYAGASLGSERVLRVTLPGKAPFALAVYLRPAPIGFAPGVYAVDADFSGRIPDLAALRAGQYPGGGGRDFAGEPVSWSADCQDVGHVSVKRMKRG